MPVQEPVSVDPVNADATTNAVEVDETTGSVKPFNFVPSVPAPNPENVTGVPGRKRLVAVTVMRLFDALRAVTEAVNDAPEFENGV